MPTKNNLMQKLIRPELVQVLFRLVQKIYRTELDGCHFIVPNRYAFCQTLHKQILKWILNFKAGAWAGASASDWISESR
jgi:hypothetical protein